MTGQQRLVGVGGGSFAVSGIIQVKNECAQMCLRSTIVEGAAEVMRITPIEFRDAFASVVCERATELHGQWRNNAAYSAFVRAEVLQPIAARLALRAWCLRDYFHLDAVFYEERDEEHFAAHETWAKAISVAIEHENARGPGTYREMNKLQLFNAPLKVLITYTSDNKQANALLGEYSKIIRDADTSVISRPSAASSWYSATCPVRGVAGPSMSMGRTASVRWPNLNFELGQRNGRR
jgi:hypothetical protein